MAERNLIRTKCLILREIQTNQNMTIASISKELKISYKHTFQLVKEMHQGGLIKKSKSTDKRLVLLSLTNKGHSKLDDYAQIFENDSKVKCRIS